MLQAYQADLLKQRDEGQGLSPDMVAELHHAMYLVLWITKQTAAAIGHSMMAMMAMKRHLWFNLADTGQKEINFLLNAPVLLFELFGTSVETVTELFREAKMRLVI